MESGDTFRLITEEQAGAILGAIAAGLFLYDLCNRFVEWMAR